MRLGKNEQLTTGLYKCTCVTVARVELPTYAKMLISTEKEGTLLLQLQVTAEAPSNAVSQLTLHLSLLIKLYKSFRCAPVSFYGYLPIDSMAAEPNLDFYDRPNERNIAIYCALIDIGSLPSLSALPLRALHPAH